MATYTGDGGDNSYTGTVNADQISGGGGNDTLAGGGGADTIDGDAGNDVLYSGTLSPNWDNPNITPILDVGSEIDVLRGWAGNDVLFAGYGDAVDGGADFDTLFISFRGASAGITANFATLVAGGTLTIGGGTIKNIERVMWVEGSEFADDITMPDSSPSAPIYGLGGDDHIVAAGGVGEIHGGDGNDSIDAHLSAYSSPAYGDAGDDVIQTSFGFTYGGIGNDTISGGGRLFGEDGNDTLTAIWAGFTPFLYGGAGVDDLTGSGVSDILSGGDGADTIHGGGGADTIYSATLPEGTGDYFDHGSEHDVIDAGAGDDTVILGYGDDADGGDGIDTLVLTLDGAPAGVTLNLNIAGSGVGGVGNIVNFEKLDVLTGTAFADTIKIGAFQGRVMIVGGDGADKLTATTTSVYLLGGLGNDILTGSAVADAIQAGNDNDTLIGGGGDDSLEGEDGNDIIEGGLGDDTLKGGLGNDTASYAHAGSAVTVNMDRALPNVTGGDGFDTLDSIENVTGSGFNDQMTGDSFVNILDGGAGNDRIDGKEGADRMIGGLGDDVMVVDDAGDQIVELAGQGTDRIEASITYLLSATLENLTLTGGANIDGFGNDGANVLLGNGGINRLDGRGGADEIHGGGGSDTLNGGAGDDLVYGDAGDDTATVVGGATRADTGTDFVDLGLNDDLLIVDFSAAVQSVTCNGLSVDGTGSLGVIRMNGSDALTFRGIDRFWLTTGSAADELFGGAGPDRLAGGQGDDLYHVGQAGDLVTEAAGAGNDRVIASASYVLSASAEVEKLEAVAGTTAINLAGNGFAQTLTGNAGANILDGKGGADIMAGGAGDDWYYVDTAADQIVELPGEGNDRLFASVSYTLGAGVSVEKLSTTNAAGTAAINFTGNELAQAIYGNDGNNILDGKGGADQLVGAKGDDFFYVDSAVDFVSELAGQGNDRVFASVSYTLGAGVSVEKLSTTNNAGTTAINLTGNELANQIYGNDGANVLDGRGGADLLVGFKGDDWYYVDNAADQIQELAGDGNDRVFASVSYTLGAGVSAEKLTTTNSAGTTAINLTGNELANQIYGNNGANSLDGKAGADVMVGAKGDDFYYVDSALDRIQELTGEGNDRLFASASYALAAGVSVEKLTTINTAAATAINLTGNELAQELDGNDGANSLDGKAGADLLIGFKGDDLYYVDNAGDQIQELAGQGNDRIFTSIGYTLAAGVSVEKLTTTNNASTTAINLAGNELDNAIYGNAGANDLDGKGGGDLLVGLLGDDVYHVDSAADRIVEAIGEGNDQLIATVSYALSQGVSIETMFAAAGTAAINLTGNELANHLTGNDGDNILCGGLGQDILYGGGGADGFLFNVAPGLADADGLTDFASGIDKILLDHTIFTGLPLGTLSLSAFNDGSTAPDADDRIYYSNEFLYFDADGSGPGQAVIFATTAGLVPVNASDFIVV